MPLNVMLIKLLLILFLISYINPKKILKSMCCLIHDVNPLQLSGDLTDLVKMSLREALLDARRDTVTHSATSVLCVFSF